MTQNTTVTENQNIVVNAETAPKMVTVGRHQYAADRVNTVVATIVAVNRDTSFDVTRTKAIAADPDWKGPKFRIAVKLDTPVAWVYNKRAGVVELGTTVWLNNFDVQHAFACNEVLNLLYHDDVMMTGDFSVFLGTQLHLTQVKVLKNEEFINPYGYESYTRNGNKEKGYEAHDDVVNVVNDIKVAPYGAGNFGLDQKNIMLAYAETRLRQGHSADDVMDHLDGHTCMTELDSKHMNMLSNDVKARAAVVNTALPIDTMRAIMAYAKDMASLGLDAETIVATIDTLDIPKMTDSQLEVITKAVIKVVEAAN